MPETGWLEAMPEAAVLVDPQGSLVATNSVADALFGPDALSPGDRLPGFSRWLAAGGDELLRGRIRARRPNGVPVTVELSARRLEGGGALCLLVEPDRERVADLAQRYFDIAFDAAPIGMALFNTDGEYVRVNAALCDLLGRPEGELLGHRDQELTHPDDRQSDVDAAWRILRGELHTWQCEKRFLRPDGSVVWTIANLTFLRDEDGNPISWVGQFQDITERKRDEKELQETLSLLAATLDATADGILVVDPAGTMTSFNHRFAEMWRLPASVLESRDDAAALAAVLAQVCDPDAFVAKVEELYHRPEAESDDVIEFLDGRVFERTSKPQRIDGRVLGRVWSFHDVTERRRLEADLASALATAQEASRLKSAFVATMSHEIRTPMNGVLGLAELLLDSDLDAGQRRHVLALRESGRTLMALINDILDFSKFEAGKLDLEAIDFDLADTVRAAGSAVAAQARDKGLDLNLDVGGDVPAQVRGDPLRLRQVLVNLASNAVKFTDAGTVTIAVAPTPAGRLRFLVRDTGIGIDEGARERLLEPFCQADSSTTRRFGGTGLGLTISAQLVGLMGGELDFKSRLGEGSTFWFDVPLPAAPVPPPEPAVAVEEVDEIPAGACVLLADDAHINRLVGVALLERLGCRVDVATNGVEAVDAALRTRYDAILMDCLMPVMDGYEATHQIRRLESGAHHTPIVALTASAMVGDRERCLAAGMDEYLSKPLDRLALARVLGRCLARSVHQGLVGKPAT
ncbi:MAG TPA: PAS domain S-box protein [Acidimicrobiales bacterium]|nr:PAS domain S-box protein [Acidimicrobiales bacterium]